MREDYQEALDKMFPDGYAIGYTMPNGDIRFAMFNPHGDKTIFRLNEIAKEF